MGFTSIWILPEYNKFNSDSVLTELQDRPNLDPTRVNIAFICLVLGFLQWSNRYNGKP